MTSPIIDFIEARLKADQDAAEAAQDLMESPWQATPEGPEAENYSGEFRISNGLTIAGHVEEAKARHIVLHQPARVLREVAAKRRVLARHHPADEEEQSLHGGGWEQPCVGCRDYDTDMGHLEWNTNDVNDCPELRDLAAAYSDHEAYRPEWRSE